MNRKIIGRMLGVLFLLEALFMLPPLALGLWDGSAAAVRAFAASILILLVSGGALYSICRGADKLYYSKESFATMSLGWLLLSLLGCLPFYFSGEIPAFADAFFEAVAGLTTAGSSILTDVEALSRPMLLWRSLTHWVGGMGFLLFLVVLLPSGGGRATHLLSAENPGLQTQKLVPKMHKTAAMLYKVYLGLTLACLLLLLAGGLPLFDSLCLALGTVSTGGFAVKNGSIMTYSPYIKAVITVFMLLCGVNFGIYFKLFDRDSAKRRSALRDEELRCYLGVIAGATALITLSLAPLYGGAVKALFTAFFTVSSTVSTAGFFIADYNTWPQLARMLIMLLMFAGGCAGSTSSGLKLSRVLVIVKSVRWEVHKMMRPRRVEVVRLSGRPVDAQTVHAANIYLAAYMLLFVLCWLLVSLDGHSLESNFTAVLTCLSNGSPGLGAVGPVGSFAGYSVFSKIVFSFAMVFGRLEIFPMLVLLSPDLWRRGGKKVSQNI